MAITSGVLSLVTQNSEFIQAQATPATDGVGPYEYQWHKGATAGFTPSGGTAIAGATDLILKDSGNIPNTTVYYKLVSTDTGASNAEATSAALTVVIPNSSPAINSFEQKPVAGMVDLPISPNTISAQVDSSETGTIYNGEPIMLVPDAHGVPKVKKLTDGSSIPYGVVNFSVKRNAYKAGDALEISQDGNVVFVYASEAIARGAKVSYDYTDKAFKTQAGVEPVIGSAFDGAVAKGSLFRLRLSVPS